MWGYIKSVTDFARRGLESMESVARSLDTIAASSQEMAKTAAAQRAILAPWPDTQHEHPRPGQTPVRLVSERADLIERGNHDRP